MIQIDMVDICIYIAYYFSEWPSCSLEFVFEDVDGTRDTLRMPLVFDLRHTIGLLMA